MPSKRRRRKGAKRPHLPKAKTAPHPNDLRVVSIVTKLNLLFSFVGSLILLARLLDLPTLSTAPIWLFRICLVIFLIIMLIIWKLGNRAVRLFSLDIDFNSVKQIRRLTIWQLSLQPFLLIVIAMPALYAHGYVTRFSNSLFAWLPAQQKVGRNLSLVTAFGAGAIVSGIIGNLAYDLLKLAVKSMAGKD